MRTITIGVDLAKSVFSVCAADAAGRVLERRDLRREAFNQWLASLPAGTAVAMEKRGQRTNSIETLMFSDPFLARTRAYGAGISCGQLP